MIIPTAVRVEHFSEGCYFVRYHCGISSVHVSNSDTFPLPWFTVGLKYCCIVVSPEILILLLKLEFVSKQDSFSVIHCEIQVLLSRPEALKRVDLLMVLSLWLCRIVLWIHPISFLWREKLELRHDSNDFWPPSFIYSLNPQTFSPFPSFRDNTRNCRRGLRLLDPRLTTTHTPKQEQKVVKKKYS